jgi:hypothetical protein
MPFSFIASPITGKPFHNEGLILEKMLTQKASESVKLRWSFGEVLVKFALFRG